MLILAFVHALELKLHNIGKPVIDLRDLSTFAVYRVHRTLLAAPLQAVLHLCTLNPCTAPWFLHGDVGSLFGGLFPRLNLYALAVPVFR